MTLRQFVPFVFMGIFLSALFFVPLEPAYAQSAFKIVPDCPATGCRACDLVALGNGVMKFLLMISVFVAALILAYAGLQAVITGTGSELVGTAVNIIGGILIMLLGWLVVDTVIRVMTGDSFGPWNTISCTDNPVLEKGQEKAVNPVSVIPGSEGTRESYGNGDTATNGSPQSTPDPSQQGTGDCSAEALSGFGSGAAGMSCIAQAESRCNPTVCGDNGFSCGTFQINMTAHQVTCNGQTLDCPSAFTGMYTGSNRNVSVRPGMEGLAAQCKSALQDPACNQQVAQGIYNRQGFGPWSTARGCGLR